MMSNFQKNRNQSWRRNNRFEFDTTVRHVTFKNDGNTGEGRGGYKRRPQKFNEKLRQMIVDNDSSIRDLTVNKTRFEPYKGNPRKKDGHGLHESPSSWFKVTLANGKKYDKKELIKKLQAYLQPVPLLPIGLRFEDSDLVFYVDSYKIANSLKACNFKIDLKDGWKLQVRVNPQSSVTVDVDNKLKQTIKLIMAKRYNVVGNLLDLSKFVIDEDFLKEDLFVPLNRPEILLIVFQIIGEDVPHLNGLNLSENKIYSTEYFSLLKQYAKSLKILNLANNRIRNLNDIKQLEGLPLEEISLDNNPLCESFREKTHYIRQIRKLFPNIRRLDGIELPPAVTFGIEEQICQLPAPQACYLCNAEAQVVVRQIIEQYYMLYDGPNRQALMQAYHDEVQFSLSVFWSRGPSLSKYVTNSRNLMKISISRGMKLLHTGKENVVNFLDTLPKTEHNSATFICDLTYCASDKLIISLCGLFREGGSTSNNIPLIRSFNRLLVVVPVGSGFNIINDQLVITNPNKHQLEAYNTLKKSVAETSSLSSSVSSLTLSVPSSSTQLPAADLVEVTKQEMINTLSAQTGMNHLWAQKCLFDTNWDLNTAFQAFTECNSKGLIPAEAFSSV